MGWEATEPVTSPTAGAILDTISVSAGGYFSVTLALTSPGPWMVLLRRRNVQNRITHSMLLATPGGSVVLGPFPDIMVGPGDSLEVVNRDDVVGEHQATIFTRRGR